MLQGKTKKDAEFKAWVLRMLLKLDGVDSDGFEHLVSSEAFGMDKASAGVGGRNLACRVLHGG